jgi:hypothetical protein
LSIGNELKARKLRIHKRESLSSIADLALAKTGYQLLLEEIKE